MRTVIPLYLEYYTYPVLSRHTVAEAHSRMTINIP